MLDIQQITLRLGSKTLLENASVNCPVGAKCGLLGRNGSGKSSLMRVLLGEIEPEKGQINLPKDWRMAALAQSLPDGSQALCDYVCHGDKIWSDITKRLQIAEAKQDGMAIADCHEQLQQIDGYAVPANAESILQGLGFANASLYQPLATFSGGWQMRAQLAWLMMSRAELLLLDEPTNHLDLESIVFLEQWLSEHTATALIISHDRAFMDTVCSHTIHLANSQLKRYTGGATAFFKQYQAMQQQQQKMAEKMQKKRAHMEDFVRRFRAKASKAKQAQSRVKALEKMQFSSEVAFESPCHFSFEPCQALGWPAISVKGDMGYETKTILENVRWSAGGQDKIGIIGLNGAGKTTFLKSLMGVLALRNGERECHSQVKMAYYSQQQMDQLREDDSPLSAMLASDLKLTEREARHYLGKFYFQGDRIFEKIAGFSGGEKARLALAIISWQRPNVLILDEPTNHLDMPMREALIDALQDFQGMVLLVSHDRHLLNCAVDRYCLIHAGRCQEFEGSLDDYERMQKQSTRKPSEKNDRQQPKVTQQRKQQNHEKKLERIEKAMAKHQEHLKTLDKKLSEQALYEDHNKKNLNQLLTERADVEALLKQCEMDWETLADSI